MLRSHLGIAFLLATALVAQDASKSSEVLLFGVYTSDRPTVMYRKFAPVLDHLGQSLTRELGRPVELKLRIFKTYTGARRALVEGKIDLARFGAASYCLAAQENKAVELLAMEAKKGKRSFAGYIVVRQDSPITKLAQLRGKSFAFGDRNSTIGRYLSQLQLMSAGLKSKDLGRQEFLGRHDRVFRAVQAGEFVAGALKSGTFKKLNKNSQLRVLQHFDVPTKPWVARAGMDKEISASLRKALLSLKDKRALKSLKASGFLSTAPKHYAQVAASLDAAKGFRPPAARPGK